MQIIKVSALYLYGDFRRKMVLHRMSGKMIEYHNFFKNQVISRQVDKSGMTRIPSNLKKNKPIHDNRMRGKKNKTSKYIN